MVQDTAVKDDGLQPAERAPAPITPEHMPGAIEAILLTLDKPVGARRVAEALGLAPPESPSEGPEVKVVRKGKTKASDGVRIVEEAVAALNTQYEQTGRSFRIQSVAGGLRIMTLPEFAPAVAAFHRARAGGRLSRAAVETLAITP